MAGLLDAADVAFWKADAEDEEEEKMLSCGKAPSQALPGRELGAERGVEAGREGGGGGGMNAGLVMMARAAWAWDCAATPGAMMA